MTDRETRLRMARAFREVSLGLICLFGIHNVDPDLWANTAGVLGRLFRRHLALEESLGNGDKRRALHTLVDELDEVIGDEL